MNPTQEARNWKRLCWGKNPPRPRPDPLPVFTVDPPLMHPERLTDPRWQRKKFKMTGYANFLRRNGLLIESRLADHYRNLSPVNREQLDPSDATVALPGIEIQPD